MKETLVVLAVLAAPILCEAQQFGGNNPTACRDARTALVGKHLTWCDGRAASIRDLANAFAPILWFSPSEPLLHGAARKPGAESQRTDALLQSTEKIIDAATDALIVIPEHLPGDPARKPVVYYQLQEVFTEGPKASQWSKDGDSGDPKIDLRNVERLTFRYFFYYARDIGTNAHREDIEGAEVKLAIEHIPEGSECRRVWLWRYKGLAHGLDWTANRLRILRSRAPGGKGWEVPFDWTPNDETSESKASNVWAALDTLLPVTLLVEEGKHASCTDRNGDGAYTPGYDVNHKPSDAWGVRDNFGSGLLAGSYKADSTKPRHPEDRVFPPVFHQMKNAYEACSAPQQTWNAGQQYELRPAFQAADRFSHDTEEKVRHPELLGDLQNEGFLRSTPRVNPRSISNYLSLNGSISYRADGQENLTGLLAGLHPGVGWLVPRVHWSFQHGLRKFDGPHTWGFDVLYTPSASRWIDWYAVAVGKQFRDDARWQFLPEVGAKLRLVTKEIPLLSKFKRTWLIRFVQLIGARAGIRFERPDADPSQAEAPQLRRVRFVFEVGGGAW